MQGFAIIIIIVLFIWIAGPYIMRWLKRKAMERAEDYMRQSMGLPPRHKNKKWWRKSGNQNEDEFQRRGRGREQGTYQNTGQHRSYRSGSHSSEPLIPKEYAEDVEFTETKDYSHSEVRQSSENGHTVYHESQISDAEWTEIKQTRSK